MKTNGWLSAIFVLICTPAFADSTDSMNDSFQEIVVKYLAADPKPQLPEEARKFRIQAEYEVQNKQFDKAAELYGKALEVAPWWPEGHFNRAMLLGETKKYQDAISDMKHYLLLVPDAPDARAAQDKIYQWEAGATAAKETAAKAVKRLECDYTGGWAPPKFELSFDNSNHTVTHGPHTYPFQGDWRAFMRWKDDEIGVSKLFPDSDTPGEYAGTVGIDNFIQRNVQCKPLD